jgi:AcrR family transcriptional regulator
MSNTKEHILFTALKLILTKGYGNVTMSELVNASGLSKGAFYHYFTSKDQIYHNTLDKYFFSYLNTFELTYNPEWSFKENLFNTLNQFLQFAKEIEFLIGPENNMISYYQTMLDASIRSEKVKDKMIKFYEFYVQRIDEWIKIAQNNNEIHISLNSQVLSKHICGLMEGTMIIYSYQSKEKDIEKYFNEIFYQFFELIKNKNLDEKK